MSESYNWGFELLKLEKKRFKNQPSDNLIQQFLNIWVIWV